jgi:hypothetical protein
MGSEVCKFIQTLSAEFLQNFGKRLIMWASSGVPSGVKKTLSHKLESQFNLESNTIYRMLISQASRRYNCFLFKPIVGERDRKRMTDSKFPFPKPRRLIVLHHVDLVYLYMLLLSNVLSIVQKLSYSSKNRGHAHKGNGCMAATAMPWQT